MKKIFLVNLVFWGAEGGGEGAIVIEPKPKPKKQFVNLADVRARFFGMN